MNLPNTQSLTIELKSHLSLSLSLSKSSTLQQEWKLGMNTKKGHGQWRRTEF